MEKVREDFLEEAVFDRSLEVTLNGTVEYAQGEIRAPKRRW